MFNLKSNLLIFVILSLSAVMVGCSESKPVQIAGNTMGTTYHIKYVPKNSSPKSIEVSKKIAYLLEEINRRLSTYDNKSEISYFNQQQPYGEWLKISSDFFDVTKHALEVAEKTKGIFDPTIGPLVNLWGFGPDGEKKIPTQEDVERAKKRVGYDKIELGQSAIRKTIPGVYLDLSASAKGYAVDRVATLLTEMGIENFLVEIGGEISTRGTKGKNRWTLGIEVPEIGNFPGRIQKIIHVKDLAMATSGNYRNFFEEKGVKYSHAIDYRTGRPIEDNLVSVTVLDSECMRADSWATALMVMGPDKGIKFAEDNNLAVYFVYKLKSEQNFRTKATKEFTKLIGEL